MDSTHCHIPELGGIPSGVSRKAICHRPSIEPSTTDLRYERAGGIDRPDRQRASLASRIGCVLSLPGSGQAMDFRTPLSEQRRRRRAVQTVSEPDSQALQVPASRDKERRRNGPDHPKQDRDPPQRAGGRGIDALVCGTPGHWRVRRSLQHPDTRPQAGRAPVGNARTEKRGDSPTRLGRRRALVLRSVYKRGDGRKIIGESAIDRDADP
jgi:hypothetical protein